MCTNARENGIVLEKHAGGSRVAVAQVQKLDLITENNSGVEFEIKMVFICQEDWGGKQNATGVHKVNDEAPWMRNPRFDHQ